MVEFRRIEFRINFQSLRINNGLNRAVSIFQVCPVNRMPNWKNIHQERSGGSTDRDLPQDTTMWKNRGKRDISVPQRLWSHSRIQLNCPCLTVDSCRLADITVSFIIMCVEIVLRKIVAESYRHCKIVLKDENCFVWCPVGQSHIRKNSGVQTFCTTFLQLILSVQQCWKIEKTISVL